jgi:hypothetical protein
MALMLIDETVTFRSIHDLPRWDPRVLRLRAKVRLEAPAAGRAGTGRLPLVEIALNDGASHAGYRAYSGTIENPMTREQWSPNAEI